MTLTAPVIRGSDSLSCYIIDTYGLDEVWLRHHGKYQRHFDMFNLPHLLTRHTVK